MIKKIIIVMVAFLCAGPLFSQSNTTALEKGLTSAIKKVNHPLKKVNYPQNIEALENLFFLDMIVETMFYAPDGSRYDDMYLLENRIGQDKECKLFPLNNHWVIGSIKCIGTSTQDRDIYTDLRNVYSRTVMPEAWTAAQNINVSIQEYKNFFVYKTDAVCEEDKPECRSAGIFLLNIKNNLPLVNKVSRMAKPFLLISKPKKNIFSFFPSDKKGALELMVQTRFGIKELLRVRKLAEKSYKNGYFKVETSLFTLSAGAGDPIYLVNKSTNQVFLAGFNAGDMWGTHGSLIERGRPGTSPYFYDFNEGYYKFLQDTISAINKNDWKEIKKKILYR